MSSDSPEAEQLRQQIRQLLAMMALHPDTVKEIVCMPLERQARILRIMCLVMAHLDVVRGDEAITMH